MASIDEKTKEQIGQDKIKRLIQKCQEGYGAIYPVRVVENTYLSGVDYEEKGYSITAASLDWINARTDHKSILLFCNYLASFMLKECNQKKVCVSDEFNGTMTTFYNENI